MNFESRGENWIISQFVRFAATWITVPTGLLWWITKYSSSLTVWKSSVWQLRTEKVWQHCCTSNNQASHASALQSKCLSNLNTKISVFCRGYFLITPRLQIDAMCTSSWLHYFFYRAFNIVVSKVGRYSSNKLEGEKKFCEG